MQRKISPKIVLYARTRAREILMYLRARVRAHRGFFIAFFTVFKTYFCRFQAELRIKIRCK